MWQKFIKFINSKKEKRYWRKKAKINRPCRRACDDELCQKVGCLNQDGFALRTRINLLFKRLERAGKDTTAPKKGPVINVGGPAKKKPNRKLKIEVVETPVKQKVQLPIKQEVQIPIKGTTATATATLTITAASPAPRKTAEIIDLSEWREKHRDDE